MLRLKIRNFVLRGVLTKCRHRFGGPSLSLPPLFNVEFVGSLLGSGWRRVSPHHGGILLEQAADRVCAAVRRGFLGDLRDPWAFRLLCLEWLFSGRDALWHRPLKTEGKAKNEFSNLLKTSRD